MVRWLALRRSLLSFRLAVFAIVIFTYCCTKYYESSKNDFSRAKYETHMEMLHRNSRILEKRLEVRDREFYMLKNQIHTADSPRVSRSEEIRLPSFFDFLPHLYAAPPGVLRPALTFYNKSINSPVEIVIGIPTISRQNFSYIIPTLQSLIAGLSINYKNQATIVVLIADEDGPETNFVTSHLQSLLTEFPYELENGLLQIIAPSKDWYPPDLHSITPTFGDQPDRMYWRTKQNLDYIFLMLYCQQKGEYYMQLEDDVMAKSGYLEQIKKFLKDKEMEDWLMLEFSSLGFIGKLFRSSDLSLITQFIALFYRQKPVDWILDLLFMNRYCHPEKSNKQCTEVAKQHRIRHRPSLFQHIGVHSSLAGKVQKLRERDFGKAHLFIAHSDNPPAKESTSLKQYLAYDLESLYAGRNFFWSLAPVAGDHVAFYFDPVINLIEFVMRTGNPEHQLDILNENAELSIRKAGEEQFLPVARFNDRGTIRVNFNQSIPVDAVKIVVHEASQNWLIINEIQVVCS